MLVNDKNSNHINNNTSLHQLYKWNQLIVLRQKDAKLIEYAQFLGIVLPQDQDLLYIAKQGFNTQLPAQWEACRAPDEQLVYRNKITKVIQEQHPLDEIFMLKVVKARNEKQLLMGLQAGLSNIVSQDQYYNEQEDYQDSKDDDNDEEDNNNSLSSPSTNYLNSEFWQLQQGQIIDINSMLPAIQQEQNISNSSSSINGSGSVSVSGNNQQQHQQKQLRIITKNKNNNKNIISNNNQQQQRQHKNLKSNNNNYNHHNNNNDIVYDDQQQLQLSNRSPNQGNNNFLESQLGQLMKISSPSSLFKSNNNKSIKSAKSVKDDEISSGTVIITEPQQQFHKKIVSSHKKHKLSLDLPSLSSSQSSSQSSSLYNYKHFHHNNHQHHHQHHHSNHQSNQQQHSNKNISIHFNNSNLTNPLKQENIFDEQQYLPQPSLMKPQDSLIKIKQMKQKLDSLKRQQVLKTALLSQLKQNNKLKLNMLKDQIKKKEGIRWYKESDGTRENRHKHKCEGQGQGQGQGEDIGKYKDQKSKSKRNKDKIIKNKQKKVKKQRNEINITTHNIQNNENNENTQKQNKQIIQQPKVIISRKRKHKQKRKRIITPNSSSSPLNKQHATPPHLPHQHHHKYNNNQQDIQSSLSQKTSQYQNNKNEDVIKCYKFTDLNF